MTLSTAGPDSSTDDVRLEIDNDIATITLNRPQSLNAVTPRLLDQLADRLAAIATNRQVRVAVITGAGTSFCAGFDLKTDQSTANQSDLHAKVERLHDLTRFIRRASFPVIASVDGYALGAGCELALCSDLIIASRDAQFGFPEVDVNLSVTGGISCLLPMAVGLAKAKELILLGERFSAEQASAYGLINIVVDRQDLATATAHLAGTLARKPALALAAAKATLNAAAPGNIDGAYEIETGYAIVTQASAESRQSQTAFTQRHGDGQA